MAGLTEEDIKNLGALTDAPKVDPLGQSSSREIEMEEVETLGGTIQKLPSRITGQLEEGYGKDIVETQDNIFEKVLAGAAKGTDTVFGPLARGFNRTLAFLPDAALNAITSGFNAATGSDIDKDILLASLRCYRWGFQNDNRNGELLIWKENEKKIKNINEQIKLIEDSV